MGIWDILFGKKKHQKRPHAQAADVGRFLESLDQKPVSSPEPAHRQQGQAPTDGKPQRQCRVVSQDRIRLDFAQGDRSAGNSYVDIAKRQLQLRDAPLSDPEVMGSALARDRQRRQLDDIHATALERLTPIPETTAREFFRNVGIQEPMRLQSDDVEGVFTNMRSRARIGAGEFGEVYFLSIGVSSDPVNECLYIHQVDGGQAYGLLVCRLPDGTLYVYNTMRNMKTKLQIQ